MKEYLRHKRKNGSVYTWPSKLFIPVPLPTKNAFQEMARMNHLSGAEFGAVIVMHYLRNPFLSVLAIKEYRDTEASERQALVENKGVESDAHEAKKADRTFGGFFNSSFPEGEEDEE